VKKVILIFSSLIFVLTGVLIITLPFKKTPFKQISTDKVTLSVPAYLHETNDIDPAAVIQLKNEEKQLFVLVHEVNDTLTLKKSFEYYSSTLIARLMNGVLFNYYPQKINGKEAIIGDIQGRVNETNVSYKLILLESPHARYRIIIGVTDSKKENLLEDIDNLTQNIIIKE
jgi:hypothetical protein